MNCAELKENPDGIDNHHTQVEVGNWENDEYRESLGDQASGARCAGEVIPQVI